VSLHNLTVVKVAICLTGLAAEQGQNTRRIQEDRAFAQLGRVDPALALAWNQIVSDVAYEDDQFLTFKGHRALAMTHIAIHDALNAVIPMYRQYAYHAHESSADAIAAAAQAAHDVVISQYPGHRTRLAEELAKWLIGIPDGPHKRRGIALGQRSAAAILAMRNGDGWDYQGTYVFSDEIGAYQATPPWDCGPAGLSVCEAVRLAHAQPVPPPSAAAAEQPGICCGLQRSQRFRPCEQRGTNR
jgi:hypothetical protein